MVDEYEAPGAFENRCTNAALTLESCINYSIDRISLDESNEDRKDNTLDVWLREGPWKPDVVISLSNLHSVRPREPGLGTSFIDGISSSTCRSCRCLGPPRRLADSSALRTCPNWSG